jgi:hypothetical protein
MRAVMRIWHGIRKLRNGRLGILTRVELGSYSLGLLSVYRKLKPLCASSVNSVPLWWRFGAHKIHHRGTEFTEDAQRNERRNYIFDRGLAEILSLDGLNFFDAFPMSVFGHFSCQPGVDDVAHFRTGDRLAAQRKNIGAVMLARVARHCR